MALKRVLLISFCLSLYLWTHNKAASCFTFFLVLPFFHSLFLFFCSFLPLRDFISFVRFLQFLRFQENTFCILLYLFKYGSSFCFVFFLINIFLPPLGEDSVPGF